MFAAYSLVVLIVFPSFIFAAQEKNSQPEKIIIGAALSQSGRFIVEGKATQEGYDVWKKMVNEQGGIQVGTKKIPVEIIYEDDKSDPQVLLSIYQNKFLNKVQFILGPYSSMLCGPASQFAEKNHIIFIQGNGTANSLFTPENKYSFGVATPAQKELHSTLEMLKDAGAQSIAMAFEHEPYAMNVAEGAKIWAKKNNIAIHSVEYAHIKDDIEQNPKEKDAAEKKFETFIRNFKKLSPAPDIFIGCGHFFDSIRYVKISEKVDFLPHAIALTIGPTNPKFEQILGANANGILCSMQWDPTMNYQDTTLFMNVFRNPQDYVARFKQFTKKSAPPSFIAAQSSAAAEVLQIAIQKAKSLETQKILDQLRSMNISTFFGPVKFDNTGKNDAIIMGVMQIQNGQPVLIGPKSILSSEGYSLMYPKKPWLI